MCIYVQSPLTESIPYIVHPTPKGSVALDSPDLARTGGSALFYDFSFGKGIDYGAAGAPTIPNGEYMINGPHPSDIITGYEETTQTATYMDQVFSVGSNASGWSKSVEATQLMLREYQKLGTFGDRGSRAFGYATCHWLAHCDANVHKLGSRCHAQLSGVNYSGFCFYSDAQQLECGHLSAMDNQHGEKPIAFDRASSPNVMPSQAGVVPSPTSASVQIIPSTPGASGDVYRCPTGSPAKSLGSFVSKQMLVAGCMNSNDTAYSILADVHVPAYCASPIDYKVGCLIPSAANFDPLARQSGKCVFSTRGCTSRTAVNYNSDATLEDPNEPCIEARVGCTVNSESFAGVPEDTPGYRNGFFGSPARGVGVISERVYNGPAVLNYDVMANVLDSCDVAIEGCMDSTAANYDPHATINSGSWCIPAVVGCMMPNEFNARWDYSNPSASGRDGLNANFSLLTTVHEPAFCQIARYGCSQSHGTFAWSKNSVQSANYDPFATVDTECYWRRGGCLNPAAMNYGCDSHDDSSPCSFEEKVTHHVPTVCKYPWDLDPSPPAPPPPRLPPGWTMDVPGIVVSYQVDFSFIVSGEVAYFTSAVQDLAVTTFKATMGFGDGDNVTLHVEAASVKLIFVYTADSEALLDAAMTMARIALGTSVSSLQASLGDAIGVNVLTPVAVEKRVEIVLPLDADVKVGPSAGEIVGVVAAVLLAIAICGRMTARAVQKSDPKRWADYASYPTIAGQASRVASPAYDQTSGFGWQRNKVHPAP